MLGEGRSDDIKLGVLASEIVKSNKREREREEERKKNSGYYF